MRITNVIKDFGDFKLEIEDLSLAQGQIHGLIGGNGSGKSTLAKVMMGIIPIDKGKIDFEEISSKDVTMTFQRPYLLRDTVYHNIIYPLKLRKKEINQDEVNNWLSLFNLEEKKDSYALSLSSGQRQKLSFIRAMIFNPKIVIIDETLSNIDPDTVAKMENWILANQKKEPKTYLIISHQIGNITRLCDQVHALDNGKLIESGPTKQVLFHSKRPEIRRYMKDYALTQPDLDN